MYCTHCGRQLEQHEVCNCMEGLESSSSGTKTDNLMICLKHVIGPMFNGKSGRRKGALVLAAIMCAAILISSLGSFKENHLLGMWKISPNSMPGYGICLEIDQHSIKASGDYVTYGGVMKFDYDIVSDTEILLKYDWTFYEWPWDFPYADAIPLRYSLNTTENTLTLNWAGTDFVFLDNTNNMNYFESTGAVMTGGSVTLQKVKG